MDLAYWTVNIYFLLLISSFLMSIRAIWKKDYEALSWNVFMMAGCFLGIRAGWWAWIRFVSGLYNIGWNG
jgi:hypothetical protein